MIKIVMTVLYLFAAWFPVRHYIHMFQLNSYKPKVQLKWLKTNNHFWLVFPAAVLLLCFAAFQNPANLGLALRLYRPACDVRLYGLCAFSEKKLQNPTQIHREG